MTAPAEPRRTEMLELTDWGKPAKRLPVGMLHEVAAVLKFLEVNPW